MSHRKRILILALGFILFLVAFLVIMTFSRKSETSFTPTFSTYYTDDHGTHALYRILDNSSNFKVEKNYQPFEKIDEYKGGNFVFIAPKEAFSEAETDHFTDLIFKGSHAIVCIKENLNFLEKLGIYLSEVAEPDDYKLGNLELLPALPNPVYYGIDPRHYLRREGSETLIFNSSNQDFQYHFVSDTLPIRTIFLSPEGETHIAFVPYGKGGIYLISNPHPFTNGGLRFKSNVSLVTAIFQQIRSRNLAPFIFDEYHHGFHMEAVATPISIPEVRYLVWGILITFALTIWSLGKRRQKAVPIIREPRRSISEYVNSMGSIYQRKGGVPFLYKDLVNRFGNRLSLSLRLSKKKINDPEILYSAASQKWDKEEADKLKTIMKGLGKVKSNQSGYLEMVQKIRKFSIRNKLDIHV